MDGDRAEVTGRGGVFVFVAGRDGASRRDGEGARCAREAGLSGQRVGGRGGDFARPDGAEGRDGEVDSAS